VRVVVDCGLARVPVHEPDVGVTRLETVKVSRAAADQRRGRAGRTQPGVCIRLWPEAATLSLEAFARPEILAADLAPLLLDCAAWGVADPTTLRFLDDPPAMALKEARGLLRELGALDDAGRLDDQGRAMRALPVAPRLAAMILAARGQGAGHIAGELAVLLSEQGLGGDGVDIEERLSRFRRERSPRAEEARRMAVNLGGRGGQDGADHDDSGHSAGYWLAKAYPDRVARQRGAEGHFVMANGRGGRLDPTERLAREEWIVVADLTGTAQNARILAAAALQAGEVEMLAGDRLAERDEIGFDAAARALRCRRVRRLGAIILSAKPLPMPTGAEAAAEAAKVLAKGLAGLPPAHWPWSAPSRQWRDRVAFLHAAEAGDGNAWPDVSHAALAATMEEWLGPHLAGVASVAAIGADRFFEALKGLVDWPLHKRLESDAPTHLIAPTGSRLAVDYAAEAGPTVSVRVQELYGLSTHPALAHGRIPVVLELLSPAHRPIQVTRDLPGFWKGSWAAVRAEMRGRYPRHPWPEDPAQAQATTRAKPRGT
jgi:ATP-dependent helicase HrpB